MLPYERFAAWKLCYKLTLDVYRATARFPKNELYGLGHEGEAVESSHLLPPCTAYYRPLPPFFHSTRASWLPSGAPSSASRPASASWSSSSA